MSLDEFEREVVRVIAADHHLHASGRPVCPDPASPESLKLAATSAASEALGRRS